MSRPHSRMMHTCGCHHFNLWLGGRVLRSSSKIADSHSRKIIFTLTPSSCERPRFSLASSTSLFSVAVVSFRHRGAERHPHPILLLRTCACLFQASHFSSGRR
ncbi:hypothetical protein IQ06DRAFT_47469 [Phaeosphaeriaceae sp. SRC1lsM3a]|nr:hypothetical protein IQ06DRAFT_47469 [Stagonospora sp. SRC1lsM3a]